jgi:D-glycero-D-manno-heptose 1,7-bisphosphate phosphatase
MSALPRQCAVLVGGLGARLGRLTKATPKPLLNCGGRPFLAWILRELSRFGIEEFILLTGHFSEEVKIFAADAARYLPKIARVGVSEEPVPAGTGGALWHAREILEERFLVVNGDSWCDANLAPFIASAGSAGSLGHVLLLQVEDSSRYGIVHLDGGRIVAFHERPRTQTSGMINGGIYVLHKDVLNFLEPVCSLERDVLPHLAQKGLLTGEAIDGYFIDIGVPDDYFRASVELPKRFHRPAIFLSREGVLNTHVDWSNSSECLKWVEGAKDAVRAITDIGFHAFMVSNRARTARGHNKEQDISACWVADELRAGGAAIDDLRYSTPSMSAVPISRGLSNQCRLEPTTINDLSQRWEIDRTRSFLISNKNTDLHAATEANIPCYLFSERNLHTFLMRIFASQARPL